MGLIKSIAAYDDAIVHTETPIQPEGNGNGRSLSLASNERLQHIDDFRKPCVHFRNKFTVAGWMKGVTNSTCSLLNVSDTSTVDYKFRFNYTSPTDGITISVRASSTDKVYEWGISNVPFGTWYHFAAVVNRGLGLTDELKIFVDGERVPYASLTKSTDNPISQRKRVKVNRFIISSGSSICTHHSVAVWNKALKDEEITAIYNNGNELFNLLKRNGNYRSHKKLQHWFLWEADQTSNTNMCKDWGRAAKRERINMLTDSNGSEPVTTADLINDTPSGR